MGGVAQEFERCSPLEPIIFSRENDLHIACTEHGITLMVEDCDDKLTNRKHGNKKYRLQKITGKKYLQINSCT